MHDDGSRSLLHRRAVLLGGVAALVATACADDGPDPAAAPSSTASGGGPATTGVDTSDPTATTVPAPTTLTAADFEGVGTCVLLPEATPGPFPLERQLVRRDITEGAPGRPLRLGLRVVDAGCAPVPGSAVEIWHCDASGDYSAFEDGGSGKDEGPGTTFCRGTQIAGDDGIVELRTIYPGWYGGRAVHLHVRVHVDDRAVLTSQLYFDDAYSAEVYLAAPYAEFGPPDTLTAADRLAGDPARDGTLLVTRPATIDGEAGTLGLLHLGVEA